MKIRPLPQMFRKSAENTSERAKFPEGIVINLYCVSYITLPLACVLSLKSNFLACSE
jgi:hypothetical protein